MGTLFRICRSHDVQQQVTTLYSAQAPSLFIAMAVCLSVGTGSLRHDLHNLSEVFYIFSLVWIINTLHVVPDVLTEQSSILETRNRVLLVVLGGSKIAGVDLFPA